MSTKAQATTKAARRPGSSNPLNMNEGLTPKKTAFIIVTVIGCTAILWPKVFYPMLFGGTPPPTNNINLKDQRGPSGGCCEVVLDREQFLNSTPSQIGPQLYRKQLNLLTGEMSLRQERPAHLHPESIYQAMRERGRAIPITPTVPIVDRKGNPPPRIVEGRPGPIPGMRPPMGAGHQHQPQVKGSSMGFIMPLYTIGIIVFFGYTIMKLVCKKPIPNAPYGPAPTDPSFRKEVFGQENGRHVEDLHGTKLGTNLHSHDPRNGSELYNASLSAATAATNLTSTLKQHQQQHLQHQQQQQQQQQQAEAYAHAHAHAQSTVAKPLLHSALAFNKETEQLMEIEKLRKRLEDTEKAMAKLIAEMNSDQYEAKKSNDDNSTTSTNGDISPAHTKDEQNEPNIQLEQANIALEKSQDNGGEQEQQQQQKGKLTQQRKRRDGSAERSVEILGMEVTASCEGGKKWTGRPPTPVFPAHNEHSKDLEDIPVPQSIYLEGSLAHESQILVSDSETKTEEVYDEELNGSIDEPAVILSSKMTLSLINLDAILQNDSENNSPDDIESPLADDIEIIGHDEK